MVEHRVENPKVWALFLRSTHASMPRPRLLERAWGNIASIFRTQNRSFVRRERPPILSTPHCSTTDAVSQPDSRRLRDVLQGVRGDHHSQLCEAAAHNLAIPFWKSSHAIDRALSSRVDTNHRAQTSAVLTSSDNGL